jgi:predicted outer membrane repeat protein
MTLTWTAPGDDRESGTVALYDLRYSTFPDTIANWWDDASRVMNLPQPRLPGQLEIVRLDSLENETNYYLALKASDSSGNWSQISNVVGTTTLPDQTPPRAVDDLAVTEVTYRSALLVWTAPGDDNAQGQASQYDIRYAENPITEQLWPDAYQVEDEPIPQKAGTQEAFRVSGLQPMVDYYFALKAADEVSNWSSVSNSPGATTEEAGRVYLVRNGSPTEFPTIQAAINASVDGDVVELTDGVFKGPENRDVDYHGKAITVRSQSGQPELCIIDCEGSPESLHRGFVFQSGEPASAILEGVTIVNGQRAHPIEGGNAGAVYISGASPSFFNCRFVSNNARFGGAVDANQGVVTFVDCEFRENTSSVGGAVVLRAGEYSFIGCSFEANRTLETGGALDVGGSGVTVTASSCSFLNNGGGVEGGAIRCQNAELTLEGCVFEGNHSLHGGAVLSVGGKLTLDGCELVGNVAGGGGAGLEVESAELTMMDCLLRDNVVELQGGVGGGVSARDVDGASVVSGCVFEGNRAPVGGGVYLWDSDPTVGQVLFLDNEASSIGGGLCCDEGSEPLLYECTFFGNGAPSGGGIYSDEAAGPIIENTILSFASEGEGITCEPGADVVVACCDIFGNAGGDDVCGLDAGDNISQDPLFCESEAGDFTIQATSPCAPDNNPECGLIGALPVGCDEPMATEQTTGNQVKAAYR